MRHVILDTETTGLSPAAGHRVIEIGCVEMINRQLTGNTFHVYLQPDREVDYGAMQVHGITNEFLKDKPRFKEVFEGFKAFIENAELIIHNAPFDVGFLANEFKLIHDPWQDFESFFSIIDTLKLAREKHPGQKNNLDALCKRYGINNQHREKHGALLDAEILAKVYLSMTGGQDALLLEEVVEQTSRVKSDNLLQQESSVTQVPVLLATEAELKAHEAFLDIIEKKSGQRPLL